MDLNRQIREAMKVDTEDDSKHRTVYGTYLEEEDFEKFSEYQLDQLLTLAKELHGEGQSDPSKPPPPS